MMSFLNPVVLERCGWFLTYSFLIGLVLLPFAWLAKAAAKRLADTTRSAIALTSLVLVTFAPLLGAWWLVAPEVPAEPPNEAAATAVQPDLVAESVATDSGTVGTDSGEPILALDDAGAVSDAIGGTIFIPPVTLDTSETRPSWSAVCVLPVVWLTGSTLTACFLTLGLVGSVRLRYQSVVLDNHLQQIVDNTLAKLSGTQVTVKMCELISGPVLLGIIRPVILLPCTAVGWTPETVRFVVLHEFAHAQRRDNLINLAQRAVEAVCFYQPVIWFASAWVRAEREICCDRFVAEITKRPTEYARALVQLADERSTRRATTADHVTCSSTRHALVTRVARLLGKEETMRISIRTLLLSLTTVGLMCAVGYGALLKPDSIPVQDETTAEPISIVTEETSAEEPVAITEQPVLERLRDLQPILEPSEVRLELLPNGTVSSERAGVIRRVHVSVGDRIKKGQVLGELRMRSEEAAVARLQQEAQNDIDVRFAEASYAVAKERYEQGRKGGEIHSRATMVNLKLELEKASLQVEKAKADKQLKVLELKQGLRALETGTIVAPIDGVVTAVSGQPGSAVRLGQEVFTITNLKQIKCIFKVSVADISKIKHGGLMKFVPSDKGFSEVAGVIRYVSGAVSRVSQTADVVAILESPTEQLRAGQIGHVVVFGQVAQDRPVKQESAEPEPVAVAPPGVVELTIKQRTSKLVPGTQVRIEIDDITAGQALISIQDGSTVVLDKSLKLGDVAAFKMSGKTRYIRVRQLTNQLIGEDFAILEIASQRDAFRVEPPEELPAVAGEQATEEPRKR